MFSLLQTLLWDTEKALFSPVKEISIFHWSLWVVHNLPCKGLHSVPLRLLSVTFKEAARVANAFVQKGVDNVYLVVGGLRAVADIYPECLQGDVPPPSPTGGRSVIGYKNIMS